MASHVSKKLRPLECYGGGIIEIDPCGPQRTNQAGGFACEHPLENGTVARIYEYAVGDHLNETLSTIVTCVWGSGVGPGRFTADHARHVDAALTMCGVDWRVDINCLNKSMEAWVYVRSIDGKSRPGVLYWGNSD
jgi:hypothetical protein